MNSHADECTSPEVTLPIAPYILTGTTEAFVAVTIRRQRNSWLVAAVVGASLCEQNALLHLLSDD